jgi:hypothetical protein
MRKRSTIIYFAFLSLALLAWYVAKGSWGSGIRAERGDRDPNDMGDHASLIEVVAHEDSSRDRSESLDPGRMNASEESGRARTRLISLIRKDEVDAELSIEMSSSSVREAVRMERGQYLVEVEVPRERVELQCKQGWSLIPSVIPQSAESVAVRLIPPINAQFRVSQDGNPVVGARVCLTASSGWTDQLGPCRTDEFGRVSFAPVAIGGFSFVAFGAGYLVGWRLGQGLGMGGRVVDLSIPSELSPEREFVVIDEQSRMPLGSSRFEFADGKAIEFESSQPGHFSVPSHGGKIPAIYAVADGYRRKWVDLDQEATEIELSAVQPIEIEVLSPNRDVIPGITVYLIARHEDGEARILESVRSSSNGVASLLVPLIETSTTYYILASHPQVGMGVDQLDLHRLESTELILDTQVPLTVAMIGVSGSEVDLEYRTLDGSSLDWDSRAPGRMVISNATMLDWIKISTPGGGVSQIERWRDWDGIEACVEPGFVGAVSGTISVPTNEVSRISGQVVNPEGDPIPWQAFAISAVQYGVKQNLAAYPTLNGNAPTELPGWIDFYGRIEVWSSTDADGRFAIEGIPPAEYSVRFPAPVTEGRAAPFGANQSEYYFAVPTWGELRIVMPHTFFADYSVLDDKTGELVDMCSLEVTYTNFLESYQAASREFRGGRMLCWLSWNSGARMRVAAPGYEPVELNYPISELGDTGATDVRVIRLSRISSMKLDLVISEEVEGEAVSLRAVFKRDPDVHGQIQTIESRIVSLSGLENIELNGPVPGCVVDVAILGSDGMVLGTASSFRFEPGVERSLLFARLQESDM